MKKIQNTIHSQINKNYSNYCTYIVSQSQKAIETLKIPTISVVPTIPRAKYPDSKNFYCCCCCCCYLFQSSGIMTQTSWMRRRITNGSSIRNSGCCGCCWLLNRAAIMATFDYRQCMSSTGWYC